MSVIIQSMRQTSRVLSTVLITDVQKDEIGFKQVREEMHHQDSIMPLPAVGK